MKVRIVATRKMHFDKEVDLTEQEYKTLVDNLAFDEISDRMKEAFMIMDDNLEFNDASYLGDEFTDIELIKSDGIKEGDQVDANIGVEGGEDVWIQALVIEVAENNITVREIGGDDEWVLALDKIKKT